MKELGVGGNYKRLLAKIMVNRNDGSAHALTEKLVSQLEGMDYQQAIEVVKTLFRSVFSEWRKNPVGNLPIAVLDSVNMQVIGAKSKAVLLSADTMKKQDVHHPELTQKDYERVQEAVENGLVFKQNKKKASFTLDNTAGLAAIIKAARNKNDNYLVSLYRLSADPVKRVSQLRTLRRKKD